MIPSSIPISRLSSFTPLHSSLPTAAQSLTGRLHVVTLWPLSQGELGGIEERFAERLLTDPASLVTPEVSTTSRREYVDRLLRGGFPLALLREGDIGRNRWFDDYLDLVVERDVAGLSNIRQREKMPSLVARLGGQTAQVLNVAGVASDVGIEPSTAEHYVRLLEAAFVIHRLPAWGALGDRFLGGVVLHLGRHSYTHDDRLHAVPVDRLWLTI